MDEPQNLQDNQTVKVILPDSDEDTRKKINLAIYHDGLQVTTIHVNNVLDKFGYFFKKIFLISEDEENLEGLKIYNNLNIVAALKPINLSGEWLLILESGEFPSIQLLNNLSKIINETGPEVKIIKLPLVICHFKNGEIIDILKPSSRLFRQNPHLFENPEMEEITMEEYPIIKLYVDFSEIEEQNT